MAKWWMLTGPCTKPRFKRLLKSFVEANDVHEWDYCIEKGKKGYLHAHCKLKCNNNIGMDDIRHAFYNFHIEPSNEDTAYLRKEGSLFVSSKDTPSILKVRFGKPHPWQMDILEKASKQTDRQVTVLLDEQGALGKTWLSVYAFENHLSFYVPATIHSPKEIIQFICDGYRDQEFIIIDLPRSLKWTKELITAIEVIKDGLVYDTRYSAKWRNIRGIKLLIFTNSPPPTKALSEDRWDIVNGLLYRNTSEGRNIYTPLGV